MSPLWRDEVGIFLAPRRIVLARMKRGINPVNLAERDIVVDAREPQHWESTLATLENCLADPLWQGANARLILSDHWARYSSVPWTDQISGDAERLEHARVCMANTFGDVVTNWTITLSDAPPGCPQVGCGIPTALLTRTRNLLEAHRLRLKSVQPHLVAAFNGWRGSLPRGGAWFVTLEEGSLAAAHFMPAYWDCVRSVRIGEDWEVELKRLQTFGRLARNTADAARVYVDAPAALREKVVGSDQDIEWLGTAVESQTGRFALLERMYA